jgi:hypothetical protein
MARKPDWYDILGALVDASIVGGLALFGALGTLLSQGVPLTGSAVLTAFILAGAPAMLLYLKQVRHIDTKPQET